MRKLTAVCCSNAVIVIFLIYITACNSKKTVPFPTGNAGENSPVSKPLHLSEAQPLQWQTINPDSIQPPKTTRFDIKKLPVKPFLVNDFKPLRNPLVTRKLDWDNIPDSAINLDTIPARPFTLQQSILPRPQITKAGMPKLMSNTTTGILQFGQEEGLPGLNAYASLIDKQGTLWIATDKGLSAYTGDNLYNYTFFIKNVTGGFPNLVFKMMEDSSGRIWMGTGGGGIYIMDVKNGILSFYDSNIFWVDMFCDHSGDIWLSSYQDGLFIINKERTSIKKIQWPDNNKAGNWAIGIAEDRLHNIWLGNDDHVSIIDPDRKKIKKLGFKQGLAVFRGIEFYEDKEGNMWVGGVGGEINTISLENKTITTLNQDNGFNRSGIEYWEDKRGQMWIVHNDSITVLNKQRTARKTIITHAKSFLAGKAGLTEDKFGKIWIGSKDKGVLIIDPDGPLPEHLDSKNGLADDNIWGLLEDKNGNMWIGTYKGINIYDPAKNEVRLLGAEQGLGNNNLRGLRLLDEDNILAGLLNGFSIINLQTNTLTNYGKEQGFSSNVIWNGTKDKSGNVWATSTAGIFLYNLESRSLKRMGKSNGLLSDQVWGMEMDRDGNFWAATDSGVMVINPVYSTVRYLRQTEGLCNNNSLKITVNKRGEIWIATTNGISIVNTDKNIITNLTAREGLVPDEIYDLVEQNNQMYAGSVNGMIAITRPENDADSAGKQTKWGFVNYGKSAGFPYNDYNQMTAIVTRNGQSWWGVTPVLTILTQPPIADTSSAQVSITGIKIMDNDLNASDYSALENFLQPGDTIWDSAKKNYYTKNKLPQKAGYLANNNIRYDSLATLFKLPVGLELPYNQNSLNFSYSNSNVVGRDKIVYRYVLEGADESWSDITDKTITRSYYNLSSGNYTFRVSSKGPNGVWSTPAELSFSIRPPWWQTWWAYLLYAIIFSGAVWLIVQYRSRWLKKENRVLEEKVSHRTVQLKQTIEELKATQSQLIQSEKMASLGELTAGIAHEIQNPLNFVNNFSEVNSELITEMNQEIEQGNFEEVKSIAKNISENEQKIIFHGKRADAIVKGMLQHSRSSSGIKEPTNINALADEYLRLAYHGLRAKDKSFNATMKTDFDEEVKNANVISQDIGRVVLNLITNAFYAVTEKKRQHAGNYEPTVTVGTKRLNGKVQITVRDNGNGIPHHVLDKIFQPFFTTKPTGEGTGLGLSMSYDIITKAHSGELQVKTKDGEFAEFIITLPQ